LSTNEAQALVKLIEYDAFDGIKVAEAIDWFRGKIASWEFGREGSPVLYINLPVWTHQREGASRSKTKSRIEDAENDSLIARFDALATTLGASEFGAVDPDKRKLRIFWD
jgi:hypothetical protein